MDYRVTLTHDDDTDQVAVSFPDFPEAHTIGSSNADALAHAVDALATVIDAYIKDRRSIPAPSRAKSRTPAHVVQLPAVMVAKVAIHSAMLAEGLTKYALAKRLQWHPPQVDRLLSLRHPSKLENLVEAAAALGQRIGVSVDRLERLETKCPACRNETTISYSPGPKSVEQWACPECDAVHTITVHGSGVVATASVSKRAVGLRRVRELHHV